MADPIKARDEARHHVAVRGAPDLTIKEKGVATVAVVPPPLDLIKDKVIYGSPIIPTVISKEEEELAKLRLRLKTNRFAKNSSGMPAERALTNIQELNVVAKELYTKDLLPQNAVDILVKKALQSDSLAPLEEKEASQAQIMLKDLHKSLHNKIKTGDKSEETDRNLRNVHRFFELRKGFNDAYNLAKENAVYDKITEGMGPEIRNSLVYRVFFRDTDISMENMKNVLTLVKSLDDPDSPMVVKGNKVNLLTREEIWQAKMNLLDETINSIKAGGKPVNIDLEYYEITNPDMLRRIEEAAKLGCKIRLVMDPGRFATIGKNSASEWNPILKTKQFPKKSLDADLKPAPSGKVIAASEVLSKLRVSSFFSSQLGKYDVGICLYPVKEQLGSTQRLMHRKLFRVGDKVIFGGMNAGFYSGENVDTAFLIEGPAVKRLTEIFQKDIEVSKKAAISSIYEQKDLDLLQKGEARLDPLGIMAFLQLLAGSKEVLGIKANNASNEPKNAAKELLDKVEEQGYNVEKFVFWPDANGDKKITRTDVEEYLLKRDLKGDQLLTVSPNGGKIILHLLEKEIENLNRKENQTRLSREESQERLALLSLDPKGEDVLAIGDTPNERMAIILKTIASSEKLIETQSFVLTQLLAHLLKARKDELEEANQKIDIRCIADSGIYPDGGSPNEKGIIELEKADIPARWGVLEWTNPGHPRKIHSKSIIGDMGDQRKKIITTGSTNPSKRGLMESHELSALWFLRPEDKRNMASFNKAMDSFNKTWEKESIEINAVLLAKKHLKNHSGIDQATREDERSKIITYYSLRHINNYGKAFANKVIQPFLQDKMVWEKVQQYKIKNYSEGDAISKAVKETVPEENLKRIKENLPEWKTLKYFSNYGYSPKKDIS